VILAYPDLEKSQCAAVCNNLEECVSVVILPWEHEQVANKYYFTSPCLFSKNCTRSDANLLAVTPAWYKDDVSGVDSPVVSKIMSRRLIFNESLALVAESETEVGETEAENAMPQVVSAAAKSMVIWQTAEGVDGSGHGIRGRMLDSAGNPWEDVVEINNYTEGDQVGVVAAPLVDGRYVLVWQTGGDLDAGTNFSVVGRKFGEASSMQMRMYNHTISDEYLNLSSVSASGLVDISADVWDAARNSGGLPDGFELGLFRIERQPERTFWEVATVSHAETEQTKAVGLAIGRILGREMRRYASTMTTMPETGPCTLSSDMAFGRPVTASTNTSAQQVVGAASVAANDECVVVQADEAEVTVNLGAAVPVRTVHLQLPASMVTQPDTGCTLGITVSLKDGAAVHQCTLSSCGETAVFSCPTSDGARGQSLVVSASSVLKVCKIKAYLTTCA